MNILQFADYRASYEGNIIYSMKALATEVKRGGGELVYLFPAETATQPWAKALAARGEAVYFLCGGVVGNIRLVGRIIKKHHISIIHTHFSLFKEDFILKAAGLLSGSKPVYVRHMHMLYHSKQSLFLEEIKRRVSNADAEIACSEATKEAMLDAGLPARNLSVVVNALDFSRLDAYEAFSPDVPERTGVILMFGYNYRVKGVDLAIQAVKKLNEAGVPVCLMVVAASNKEGIVDEIVREHGSMPAFVRMVPAREDVGAYYHAAHLFLSASREESFCYAVREAAYLQCATVVSDIPAHRMTESDIRFRSGDAADLADKLQFALNKQNMAGRLEKQKQYVTEHNSVSAWCAEIMKIYAAVLRKKED